IEILKGLRDRYESHHKIKLTDESLEAAAKLSDRYITGRFLPDKAIDLMDEAGSRARLDVMIAPSGIKDLETKMQEFSKEKEVAVRSQDFEKAAKFRDLERNAKIEIEKERNNWKKERMEQIPEVGPEQIAKIVSKMTGIPLMRLEEGESEKLLKMEEEVHGRIIGQDEAIGAIARAVRRSRAGIKDPKRPIGSFVFLGPTGVGKTLLARALAEFMFGDEDALIQIDMSEYMEKFNVSRLTGAPPGYVGYEEGGQLTEKVRRRPYSVVLLDEIEKAHPDVFNILLQIFEEGRLTDSFGRRVDFKNTIVIMTSNVGAEVWKGKGVVGFKSQDETIVYNEAKARLMEEVKKVFKPEFLNRVDDLIVFHPLNRAHLKEIIDLEVAGVIKRLTEHNITLELSSKAKDFIIDKGFDPEYGARPLKRTIQRMMEDPLAEEIIAGHFKEAKKIKVDVQRDHLTFNKA
ncbi:MAG: ATP-dependent Clp protease ATP-binding subunit, partial [Candidatus Omnitrophota bacterium]